MVVEVWVGVRVIVGVNVRVGVKVGVAVRVDGEVGVSAMVAVGESAGWLAVAVARVGASEDAGLHPPAKDAKITINKHKRMNFRKVSIRLCILLKLKPRDYPYTKTIIEMVKCLSSSCSANTLAALAGRGKRYQPPMLFVP